MTGACIANRSDLKDPLVGDGLAGAARAVALAVADVPDVDHVRQVPARHVLHHDAQVPARQEHLQPGVAI